MVMNARVNKGYAAGFKCALKLFKFALMADVCAERKGEGGRKERRKTMRPRPISNGRLGCKVYQPLDLDLTEAI